MTILEIQRTLRALGYDLGTSGPAHDGVDGVWGRLSIAALKLWQQGRGHTPTGVLTPDTITAFQAAAGLKGSPPPVWYAEAIRHQGLREVPGPKHNATILLWLDRLRAGWRNDEEPWCGTFVGWCIAATLPSEPLPTNPFGARQWERFGVALREPAPGAILVFWRGKPQGWQGHVGFYDGEDADAYHVRGGNQGNAVSVTRIAKDRLTAIRWPSTVPRPATGRVIRTAAGALSRNEA